MDGVPPVVRGVVALLAVAGFAQNALPFSLFFLLRLALSVQAVPIPVAARQGGELGDHKLVIPGKL